MEANHLFLQHLVRVAQHHEVLDVFGLTVEWRVGFDGAAMLALGALERVGLVNSDTVDVTVLHLNLATPRVNVAGRLDCFRLGHLEEEALQLNEHGFNGVGRVPSLVPLALARLLEHIQTERAAEGVGVGQLSKELDRGRRYGVVCWELNLYVEDAACVGCVCWAADVGVPRVDGVVQRSRRHAHEWHVALPQFLQVLLQSPY